MQLQKLVLCCGCAGLLLFLIVESPLAYFSEREVITVTARTGQWTVADMQSESQDEADEGIADSSKLRENDNETHDHARFLLGAAVAETAQRSVVIPEKEVVGFWWRTTEQQLPGFSQSVFSIEWDDDQVAQFHIDESDAEWQLFSLETSAIDEVTFKLQVDELAVDPIFVEVLESSHTHRIDEHDIDTHFATATVEHNSQTHPFILITFAERAQFMQYQTLQLELHHDQTDEVITLFPQHNMGGFPFASRLDPTQPYFIFDASALEVSAYRPSLAVSLGSGTHTVELHNYLIDIQK